MFKSLFLNVWVLCACTTAAYAADWRVLLSEPPNLLMRLPHTENLLEDGVLNLNAGEQLVFSSADDGVLGLVIGPALLERSAAGGLLIVRQGSVALASQTAPDAQAFEVAIEDAARQEVLRGTLVSGTTYIRVAPDGLALAIESAEAWQPTVAPAEPLPAGRVLRYQDGAWQPTNEPAQSLAQSANLDLAAATARFGAQSARRDQLAVQQRLVVNLLAIDRTARARVVAEQIRLPTELRVVTIGASTTAVVAISATGSQAGLVPGQQTNFTNLTFPGVGSPASLAIGSQTSIEVLRVAAADRANFTGGQGLGTGGLFLLGVIPIGAGPGGLIGGRP